MRNTGTNYGMMSCQLKLDKDLVPFKELEYGILLTRKPKQLPRCRLLKNLVDIVVQSNPAISNTQGKQKLVPYSEGSLYHVFDIAEFDCRHASNRQSIA